MAIPDARGMAYTNLFKSQMGGGAIAVYQGMRRYQSGKGLGDFFRVLLRHIIEIALNVVKYVLLAMNDAQEKVHRSRTPRRSAVRPPAKAAIHGALIQIDQAQQRS